MSDHPKGPELSAAALDKFRRFAKEKEGPWSIVIAQVDPDGIAIAKLLKTALEHEGATVAGIYYAGSFSHPQNEEIHHRFELMKEMSPLAELPEKGSIAIGDSSSKQDSRLGPHFPYDRVEIIIDHHLDRAPLGKNGKDIWPWVHSCGAAATLGWHLVQALGVQVDRDTATLAAIGIHADTGRLTSTHTTTEDIAAFAEARGQSDAKKFADCCNFALPKRYQVFLERALATCTEIGEFRLAYVDRLMREEEGDYLSMIADHLERYEGPDTTIVWGIAGKQIRACARTATDEPLIELLGGLFGKTHIGAKHGSGGARMEMGEFFVPADDEIAVGMIGYIDATVRKKLIRLVGFEERTKR